MTSTVVVFQGWVCFALYMKENLFCSGVVIPGIKVELVGFDVPVTSVGDILSVVSVLFRFGFKEAGNVFF